MTKESRKKIMMVALIVFFGSTLALPGSCLALGMYATEHDPDSPGVGNYVLGILILIVMFLSSMITLFVMLIQQQWPERERNAKQSPRQYLVERGLTTTDEDD